MCFCKRPSCRSTLHHFPLPEFHSYETQALHIIKDKAVKFDQLLTEGLEKLAKQKEKEAAEKLEKEKKAAEAAKASKEKKSPKVKGSKTKT